MDTSIKTLGELKKSGYKPISVKEEIRRNLISKLKQKEATFPGIVGYEDTVIPDTERALLSRHNILLLGLRGQAKTRMARQITDLLDEYIPIVEGSEVNDDPFQPLSRYARDLIAEKGDKTPIAWLPRSERYGEKLATPDVSVADLVGDIDPIKAANLKLSYADERVIHFGIIPRSNRGIFVINELPDLQARIQVSLFNILQEGDIQIRGFKVRMPLDILFIFTANPEDYTNRGSIVTPLKDRIESQIITHYPKSIENSLLITEQEANIHKEQEGKVQIADMVKRLIEQVAFEARNSEYVDKKSGVSARLTIAAYENAVSAGERRSIINKEKETHVRIADLQAIVPAITGKIELVYEGEQEGPLQVAHNLLDKSIRTLFAIYFPNPDSFKKKKQVAPVENPYRTVIQWFDKGNSVQLLQDISDKQYETILNKVEGLKELVKSRFPKVSNRESFLLMEFVLHGLSSYSLISKKVVENETRFSDLLGTMMNFNMGAEEQEEF
ncbi:sigma 54-interacting transcriptional regulator [Chitinophaga nivalis]|uniref:Sigma 54-interacting transcriptional regulator n=1 Tax=Chitinophaga nivalis TaxID=2991709 RepID=A0ABT3INP1_9BACT|nr:sigma 54-interacting transcriptional regulator [Chitinophaga nivalis]MCW3464729.1 sigma 54-interacting transcriptional regulator [Chitinophaga nivalis]MCW3485580.1 sigma 54-interacting transcriptional regulator [Chitinophaga nivalis]